MEHLCERVDDGATKHADEVTCAKSSGAIQLPQKGYRLAPLTTQPGVWPVGPPLDGRTCPRPIEQLRHFVCAGSCEDADRDHEHPSSDVAAEYPKRTRAPDEQRCAYDGEGSETGANSGLHKLGPSLEGSVFEALAPIPEKLTEAQQCVLETDDLSR